VKRTIAALTAAITLLLACGDDTSTTTAATDTAGSSSAAAPQRIVSMSATATEMLFAIGAGDQVVAVDDQSNFPPEAPTTELSAYQPNVEAVAAYDPDLVVLSDPGELEAQLETLAIPVAVEPAAVTLDDTYEQIVDLGDRTGHRAEADGVVAAMKHRIAELTDDLPERATPLTYYHELDNTLYTVTSATFIGQLYSLAGLTNVADPADANGQSNGYPQLSAEYLVQADPDLVFLADTKCCAQDESTFAARPGFGGLKAVTNHHVIGLDDDVASRWGPRVVDELEVIIDAVRTVPAS